MKHIQIPYFTGRIGIDAKFSSRTISLHYEDIVELIHEEIYRYNERFGNSPTYLLLSREAYESLVIVTRGQASPIPSNDTLSQVFGIDVILNVHQNKGVMAIGDPITEMIYGGLYSNE